MIKGKLTKEGFLIGLCWRFCNKIDVPIEVTAPPLRLLQKRGSEKYQLMARKLEREKMEASRKSSFLNPIIGNLKRSDQVYKD